MKKYISIISIAILAFALNSCTKNVDGQVTVVDGVPMKTITVKTGVETRTTLDSNHENIIWSTGDKVSIFNDVNSANFEAGYVARGYITVDVPEATTEIYAHYPHWGNNSNGPQSVSININNNQTQENPGSLNGYYYPMVAKGTVSQDNKALISFYPVAGALALNIYHSGLSENEFVKSVTVTPSSANTKFAGSQITNITGNNIVYSEAANSNPITVTLTNALELGNTKPSNKQTFTGQIYVCLAKQSYANVKFEIRTTKGVYTITSNDSPFDLLNNDFVPVNINLARASFVGPEDPTSYSWTLVKNSLAIGDKVVIAAAESDVAMSTTQNNNNRGEVSVTKDGSVLTANADVQMFEVVAGSVSDAIALKCMNGEQFGKYIAAASSSNNNMHSNSSIDANASWNVEINTTSGVASVVAQGNYTKNIIKYNPTNHLFSCYGSNVSNMADVVFYRAGLPSADLSFTNASYSVNLGESFTSPTLTNPHSVPVTYSSSSPSVAAVDASTGAVTIVAAGTTTITASFEGNSSYLAGEASYELYVVDPNEERWVKTAITDITSNDIFVIVGDDGYALPHNNGSSSSPGVVSVTINANMITSEVSDAMKWNVSGNATNGFVFYPNGNSSAWLYCTNSNTGVRVGTNDNKLFTIDENGYLVHTATSRYLSVYNNLDWRCYSNTNNNPQVIDFYVKQGGSTPTRTLSSITVTPHPTQTTYSVGDSFNPAGMVVTATYSDATTADVTSSVTTDFATQVSTAGNKNVTVSYTEGGVTQTDTFSITVNAVGSTVTFDFSSLTETISGGWNGSHTVNPITITATSANTNKAGQVRFQNGGTITFSGATITRIEIINQANHSGNLSANVGTYTLSGSNGIWTGSETQVVLTNNGNGTYTTSIVVTYQ